jgi:hypothetical protein
MKKRHLRLKRQLRNWLERRKIVARRTCLLLLVVAVLLAILIWSYPSNTDFKGENPHWNGSRDILADFEAIPLFTYDALSIDGQDITLIVIPYIKFSPVELTRLEEFINSGGKLLLMDDYGFGNDILQHMGLELKFTGNQLLDPLLNYRNDKFPRIVDFIHTPNTSRVESLVFNHATCLEEVAIDNIVAQSSYFSFLDNNQNSQWDRGEPKGHMAVMAEYTIGEGEIIVIADPSILINSMLDMGDNRCLLENIIEGQLLFDQLHLPDVALDKSKTILRIGRSFLATVWGSLILIILILAIALKPMLYRRGIR